mmetsp:Transcript_22882/g.45882  ORF Transcript_22882/g.45882 Transcript_22882/m.45882 type:complete len:519 (+) Transcript_22882:77-1633(+)
MDDDIDTLVGDDVNSTADSSVSHSFYSNSLFSMTRHGDISDDDFLHRLSIKKISQDKSSASAMVTNELMRASYRHRLKRLDDDMTDTPTHIDREDDAILDLLEMAKRLDDNVDHGVSSDISAFSSPKLPIPKQIDPPEENESQHGMMASQRSSRNKMYVSASNNPRDRYRRTNTDGNFKMRAPEVDSKQQYTRRYTDSYYSGAEQRDYKRKPDPIGTGSNSNAGTHSEEEEPLIELARRMSNSCGIEDTSSIEGPNDEEYWVNSRHNSGISDGGGNRARSRERERASSRKKSHAIHNDEGKQHTGSGSKGSKMKGVFQLFSGKTNRKRDDSSSWDEGNNVRRRDRRRRRRSNSRSMSRSKRRSNSRSSRSNSGSLSSSYSPQSSRKSVNSRYSSSSRRHMHKRKNRSKLTVAEAVAYLNKKERMTKSPSLSSLKSYTSKKSSASRMSSTSRTSRKSIRSTVSSKSNGRRNSTVSKVVSAASGFKEKIRRRVVSEKANMYSSDYSDEESSCFSSSVEYM